MNYARPFGSGQYYRHEQQNLGNGCSYVEPSLSLMERKLRAHSRPILKRPCCSQCRIGIPSQQPLDRYTKNSQAYRNNQTRHQERDVHLQEQSSTNHHSPIQHQQELALQVLRKQVSQLA